MKTIIIETTKENETVMVSDIEAGIYMSIHVMGGSLRAILSPDQARDLIAAIQVAIEAAS
jgi:hypothetical protein